MTPNTQKQVTDQSAQPKPFAVADTYKLTEVYGCGEADVGAYEGLRTGAGELGQDQLNAIVGKIVNVQARITRTVLRCIQDLAPDVAYLNYLMWAWKPHLLAAKNLLKPSTKGTPRTLKCGSQGIIKYSDVGGWYVKDRDALQEHMNTLSDDEIATYGATRKVSFESEKVLAVVSKTGERLPGVEYETFTTNGAFRVGDTAPFSAVSLGRKFNAAIKSAAFNEVFEDEAGED